MHKETIDFLSSNDHIKGLENLLLIISLMSFGGFIALEIVERLN